MVVAVDEVGGGAVVELNEVAADEAVHVAEEAVVEREEGSKEEQLEAEVEAEVRGTFWSMDGKRVPMSNQIFHHLQV